MPEQCNRICAHCSAPFYVRPSRPDKFCNQSCWFQSLKRKTAQVKVKKTCQICGSVFETYPHVIARGGGRGVLCSRACRQKKLQRTVLTCPECLSPILSYAAKKYCSQTCYRRYTADRWKSVFWTYVRRTDDCWEYIGARDSHGYGRASNGQGKTTAASRVAWELTYGPIPDGLHVLHSCDNPPCVRPDHLHLGSQSENMAEAAERKRMPYGERWREIHRGAGTRGVKLTAANVRGARDRHAQGDISWVTLGTLYGVHADTIRSAVLRISWSDIE